MIYDLWNWSMVYGWNLTYLHCHDKKVMGVSECIKYMKTEGNTNAITNTNNAQSSGANFIAEQHWDN